jgi:hypothetical protein
MTTLAWVGAGMVTSALMGMIGAGCGNRPERQRDGAEIDISKSMTCG